MRIEHAEGCPAYVVYGGDYGRAGTLVQTDWDYPSVAQALGWSLLRVQPVPTGRVHAGQVVQVRVLARRPKAPICEHRGTDGTVVCPDCGVRPMQFIEAAARYLDGRCGARW